MHATGRLPDSLRAALARSGAEPPPRRAVVAVSGGADSTALLLALHRLWHPRDVQLTVAHVDHGLRGAAGAADADFVAALAHRLDLPFRLARVDVPAAVRQTGESVEMAARRLRYTALACFVRDAAAEALVTGHTRDDQIETLFLRLGRGAGPTGLGGIAPRRVRRDGLVMLRPLLECRRADLRAWLTELGEPWREDAGNADVRMLRNRVRARLLPAFEAVFGAAGVAAAARAMCLLREEDRDWLSPQVADALMQAGAAGAAEDAAAAPRGLDGAALRRLPRPLVRRVLLAWLQAHDAPPERLDATTLERLTAFALAPARGTRALPLGGGLMVRRRYDALELTPADMAPDAPLPAVTLALDGTTDCGPWGLAVEAAAATGALRAPRGHPLATPQAATLAHAALRDAAPCVLRPTRPGDRLAAVGAPGTRTVADILVDLKIPRDRRARVPLVACGERVAWLPGVGVDRAFAVASASAPSVRLTIRRIPRPAGAEADDGLRGAGS